MNETNALISKKIGTTPENILGCPMQNRKNLKEVMDIDGNGYSDDLQIAERYSDSQRSLAVLWRSHGSDIYDTLFEVEIDSDVKQIYLLTSEDGVRDPEVLIQFEDYSGLIVQSAGNHVYESDEQGLDLVAEAMACFRKKAQTRLE